MTSTKQKSFPQALAALLRSRKIKVPAGLADAPPAAYANQPPSVVDDQMAKLDDDSLAAQAAHIAGYAKRQKARIKSSWDTSPLIKEIKRRKLKLPPMPQRVVGAAVSFKKPLKEWSDAELLRAAKEWSDRGS